MFKSASEHVSFPRYSIYLTGVTYHMAEQCDEDSDDEGLLVRTMLRENVSNMKQLLMKND